jgi:ABC-type glycerol-3-phosphate transport system substrate-binding protein
MKKIIISGILLILAVVAISGCTSSDNSTSPQSEINVTNISVTSSGDGFYNINAVIIPSKNIDYLEMAAIWYDSSGAVIESSPLVWNVNNVQAGQVYKANGEDSLYQKGTPTKVELYVFDSVFSGGDTSKAIYHQTVNLKS